MIVLATIAFVGESQNCARHFSKAQIPTDAIWIVVRARHADSCTEKMNLWAYFLGAQKVRIL